MVRLQTTPGSANGIADALARRPDTRWIRLCSGGTEIACVLQARTAEQRNSLFLHGLPGSRRVVQISAHATLQVFSPVAWHGVANALSAAQLAQLTRLTKLDRARGGPSAAPGPKADSVSLRPEDDVLLAELAKNGRASNAALAKATHWHESTVRRRVAELCQAGLLYFDVDIDDVLGTGVSALLWLSVEPARLDEAGHTLAGHAEIPYAAAITGPSNLLASGVFRDTQHLYEYVTGPLARLPGVRSAETAPIISTLKRTGSLPLA